MQARDFRQRLDGSSPRVWGTLMHGAAVGLAFRFIPTGVGNTGRRCAITAFLPVHPHGCGEHPGERGIDLHDVGSSPRVWGTPFYGWRVANAARFIPTGVGNTDRLQEENARMAGSSPRVWGTRNRGGEYPPPCRFIPTGVGNTQSAQSCCCCCSVHPHGCGEHCPRDAVAPSTAGSSPRVWGTRVSTAAMGRSTWFIPTGVGNTTSCKRTIRTWPVHPHGCGEHPRPRRCCLGAGGSSPRVWGTLKEKKEAQLLQRFIPTGVGNTDRAWAEPTSLAVHPHGCGEHRKVSRICGAVTGSSPRVWGTRSIAAQMCAAYRFIPTGVGNTTTCAGHPAQPAVHPHGCGEHRRLIHAPS